MKFLKYNRLAAILSIAGVMSMYGQTPAKKEVKKMPKDAKAKIELAKEGSEAEAAEMRANRVAAVNDSLAKIPTKKIDASGEVVQMDGVPTTDVSKTMPLRKMKAVPVPEVPTFDAKDLEGKELSMAREKYVDQKITSKMAMIKNGDIKLAQGQAKIAAAQQRLDAEKGKLTAAELAAKQAKINEAKVNLEEYQSSLTAGKDKLQKAKISMQE